MFKKLFLLVFLCWALPAKAVQIVASVNDEIVTSEDVAERADLMKKMFNLPDKEVAKDKVLNTLIDEKVKLITAQKAGVVLSDEEIAQHVLFLEKQNNLPDGGLKDYAAQNGISEDSLMQQIKADLFWVRYVQQKDLKRPQISQKQVNAEIEKIKKEISKPAYLLAEIYIPFGNDESAAAKEAQDLFNRIVSGESFTDLALTYSKGKTASQMGDLGWVKAGQMEKAIDDLLPNIQSGQLSKPIRGKDGYTIILMRENRPALDSDMQEFVQVSQLVLPEGQYASLKKDLDKSAASCMAFTQFAKTHGVEGSHSGAMPEMMAIRMPADLRNLLKDKKVGELVGPVPMKPYLLFIMKCASKMESILPPKDEIERNLQMQEMEKMADKVLQDARKDLLVEIK